MSKEVLKQTLKLFDEVRSLLSDVQSLKSSYNELHEELKRNISVLTDKGVLSPDQFSDEIRRVFSEKIGWATLEAKLVKIVREEAQRSSQWPQISRIVESEVNHEASRVANDAITKAFSNKKLRADLESAVNESIVPIVEKAFANVTLEAIKPIVAQQIESLPKNIIDRLRWVDP